MNNSPSIAAATDDPPPEIVDEILRMGAVASRLLQALPEDRRCAGLADLIEDLATIYETHGDGVLPAWLVEVRGDSIPFRRGFVLRSIEAACIREMVRTPFRFIVKTHLRGVAGVANAVGIPASRLRHFLAGGELRRVHEERLQNWIVGRLPGRDRMADHLNFGLAMIAADLPLPVREDARVGMAQYLARFLIERGYRVHVALLREADWPNLTGPRSEVWF